MPPISKIISNSLRLQSTIFNCTIATQTVPLIILLHFFTTLLRQRTLRTAQKSCRLNAAAFSSAVLQGSSFSPPEHMFPFPAAQPPQLGIKTRQSPGLPFPLRWALAGTPILQSEPEQRLQIRTIGVRFATSVSLFHAGFERFILFSN